GGGRARGRHHLHREVVDAGSELAGRDQQRRREPDRGIRRCRRRDRLLDAAQRVGQHDASGRDEAGALYRYQLAEPGGRLRQRRNDGGDDGEGREVRLHDGLAQQYGERNDFGVLRLDEDDRHLKREGRPIVGLQRGPQPRHLLAPERGRRDLQELDLIRKTGRCDRRREIGDRQACDGIADVLSRENGVFVQHQQRQTQKGFGLPVVGTVGGQQVVQIQRELWVREPGPAIGADGRQVLIAPPGVVGDLVEEQIDLVLGTAARERLLHDVGRLR